VEPKVPSHRRALVREEPCPPVLRSQLDGSRADDTMNRHRAPRENGDLKSTGYPARSDRFMQPSSAPSLQDRYESARQPNSGDSRNDGQSNQERAGAVIARYQNVYLD